MSNGLDAEDLKKQKQALDEQEAQVQAERGALSKEREETGITAPTPATNPLITQGEEYLKKYEQAISEEQQARREAREKMQPEYERGISEIEQLRGDQPQRPTVPTLGEVPHRPAYIDQTAAKSLAVVASIMGTLAMAGGRGRGMLAMSALTGAMDGFREGNNAKYVAAMKEYREQVDSQLAQYNMMEQDYRNQLEARHDNLEMLFNEIQLKAKLYGDPVMDKAAEAKDYDGMIGHITDLAKLRNQLLTASSKPVTSTEATLLLNARSEGQTTGNPLIDRFSPEKAKQMLAQAPGKAPTTEQYKLLLARRASGQTTGDPQVDALSPDDARKMSGLEPKVSEAQQEKRKATMASLDAIEYAFNQAEAQLPEMERKGFLAKGEGRGAYTFAQIKQWMHPAAKELGVLKSLQGAGVGLDRTALNDLGGARALKAYEGAIQLFEPGHPLTKETIQEAFKNYRELIRINREIKLGGATSRPSGTPARSTGRGWIAPNEFNPNTDKRVQGGAKPANVPQDYILIERR